MTAARTQRRTITITPALVATDLVALVLAVLVGGHLAPLAAAGAVLGALVVAGALHLNRSRLVLSVLEDLPALAFVALTGGVLLMAFDVSGARTVGESIIGAAVTALAMLGALLVSRSLAYATVRHLRRTGVLAHRVVVVGTDKVGRELVSALRADPSLGLRPLGFVDDDVDPRTLSAPLLGPTHRLPAVLRDLSVDDVIFAFGAAEDQRTLSLVRWCQLNQRQVFVVPRYFQLLGHDRARSLEVVRDTTLVRLHRFRAQPGQVLAKRAFDVVLSLAALVVLSPLLAVAAGLLHLETRSGVLFRQERVGRGGRTFELLKLRTIPATTAEANVTWNADHDPRLGRVGKFLRRTGIDELPQLWNILRGDMSLVGPRPERPFFVQQFSETLEEYRDRHRVATGLTGWAQVNKLRGDTSIEDRVRADNYYIENWSLWTDAKILVRTLGTFRHDPARRRPEVISMLTAAAQPAGSATAD